LLGEQLQQLLYRRPGLREGIEQLEQDISRQQISPYAAVQRITARITGTV